LISQQKRRGGRGIEGRRERAGSRAEGKWMKGSGPLIF